MVISFAHSLAIQTGSDEGKFHDEVFSPWDYFYAERPCAQLRSRDVRRDKFQCRDSYGLHGVLSAGGRGEVGSGKPLSGNTAAVQRSVSASYLSEVSPCQKRVRLRRGSGFQEERQRQ